MLSFDNVTQKDPFTGLDGNSFKIKSVASSAGSRF